MHELKIIESFLKRNSRNFAGVVDALSWIISTHGTTFFIEGGDEFFFCVHGSKMSSREVMLFAVIAWMKRGGG